MIFFFQMAENKKIGVILSCTDMTGACKCGPGQCCGDNIINFLRTVEPGFDVLSNKKLSKDSKTSTRLTIWQGLKKVVFVWNCSTTGSCISTYAHELLEYAKYVQGTMNYGNFIIHIIVDDGSIPEETQKWGYVINYKAEQGDRIVEKIRDDLRGECVVWGAMCNLGPCFNI